MNYQHLEKLAKLVRHHILTSTTAVGSGHPTSSLSAVELMVGLMFGGIFHFYPDNPDFSNNDRLIFSKGHASPLLYALWTVAGKITKKELMTLRRFNSRLEGHPTMLFPFTEAATGSLGQGLSIGLGMALNAKYLDKLPYQTYVLLGDSEMSEGSVWEAIQIAHFYKLDNLVGIIDVNRLGQRGETMYGHDPEAYAKRIASFGWKTVIIDGHSFPQIFSVYKQVLRTEGKPIMVIAKTVKGKGVSFLENRNGWHGKALSEKGLTKALKELGDVDLQVKGEIAKPQNFQIRPLGFKKIRQIDYKKDQQLATRKAYGNALVRIFSKYPNIVVLDAEVSNSTYAKTFKKRYPRRFFEMFIAEQNMIGAAIGLSARGKIPFVSSFAAFLTRAFDQIRMSQYSRANVKFVGSHAGASIGEDGPSQMGLEDIAMFRTLLKSVVLYPSDAVSTEKLVEQAAKHRGIVYIRTTRKDTPVIYSNKERFFIGKSKVLKVSKKDKITVVAAGITLHEALVAYEKLKKQNIYIRVIDLYSIKPIDRRTLKNAAYKTKAIIVVEDHFAQGGVGEAVRSVFCKRSCPIYSLAVRKMPKSGTPEELLDYEEISSKAIIKKVKKILSF